MLGHAALSEVPITSVIDPFIYLVGAAYLDANLDYRICVATGEFITSSTDTPDSQPFNDRLGGDGANVYSFERTLLTGTFIGSFAQANGQIDVINTDGAYDFLPQHYAADGRAIELKVGRRGFDAYAEAVLVFKGIMSNWSIGESAVEISIEDFGYKLDVPVQNSVYGGTGGLDGGGDLVGKRKPIVWGRVLNVAPALMVPSLLIYQVSDGQIESVDAVYDRGVLLSAGSNYASYAALAAATTAAGYFDTCLALGLFKLGSTPTGTVTADLHGDASGSGYVETSGSIIRRILATRSALIDPDDLYLPAFTSLEAQQNATVGYYVDVDSPDTIKDVIARLMDGIGGAAWFRRDGKLAVGVFLEPDTVPVSRFTSLDIIDRSMTRQPLPDTVSPPPWRWRVGHQRNWTPQTDLASSVTSARRSFAAEQYRYAEASSEAVKGDHPFAKDPEPVQGYFADEADAGDEADRLLALFRATRAIYRFKIPALPGAGYKLDLNETISVTYPRWDLTVGRNMRILGLADDATSNTIEITAFG